MHYNEVFSFLRRSLSSDECAFRSNSDSETDRFEFIFLVGNYIRGAPLDPMLLIYCCIKAYFHIGYILIKIWVSEVNSDRIQRGLGKKKN